MVDTVLDNRAIVFGIRAKGTAAGFFQAVLAVAAMQLDPDSQTAALLNHGASATTRQAQSKTPTCWLAFLDLGLN